MSQVKSNSDAKKIASANSLKELAVASNLKTYTTLAQLSLSAPVTVEQIFSAMPDNSYVQIDANNSNVVTNMPIKRSGLLEISKIAGGRNFARFTESISTNAANKTMWYGVFSWSGSVAFGGWKKILERDEILATDEEIEANTDPNKIASAVAVKRLNSEFADRLQGDVRIIPEGSGAGVKYYAQVGADAASKKLLGIEPLTLRIRLQGSNAQEDYSHIPTYNKNILITRWGSGGSNLDKLAFYGANSIDDIGSKIPFRDAGDTLDCKNYKYIAVAAPGGANQTYHIQFDYN